MVIDTSHFMSRIGTGEERPKDREHWSALALWKWRTAWRRAEENKDYEAMDRLDRSYETIMSL